ncbi:MAG TPA: serine hydroxymethyltransferase [Candidatus Paceibacterota bacterium]
MKDTQIKKLIEAEKKRQKKVINLIASENYVSNDVLEALGSELTNKYAEGYSAARYYGGNEIVDKIEDICVARALKLFGLTISDWHVNVQPLSGSPANLAVYTALVPQGGKVMGMSLDHGGHLTHGHKVSLTGKAWSQIPYGIDPVTEVLNYDQLLEQATTEKPNMIIAGYTAYPRTIDWAKMRSIADAAGAILMVDMSHIAGLVAGGAYPSPFPYADIVTTTTHKTLRGPRSALIFAKKDARDMYKKIDKAVFPGLQGGPHINAVAAVAVALKEADTPAFKKYASQVVKNAATLAAELKAKGWRLISGGTDSHLILVDTWMNNLVNEKGAGGVPGKIASDVLEKNGIIVNKNTIPFDSRSPVDPSGIRIGTAAETTRGATEKDMKKIADQIDIILKKARAKLGKKEE